MCTHGRGGRRSPIERHGRGSEFPHQLRPNLPNFWREAVTCSLASPAWDRCGGRSKSTEYTGRSHPRPLGPRDATASAITTDNGAQPHAQCFKSSVFTNMVLLFSCAIYARLGFWLWSLPPHRSQSSCFPQRFFKVLASYLFTTVIREYVQGSNMQRRTVREFSPFLFY